MQNPLQAWILFGWMALAIAPAQTQAFQYSPYPSGLRPIDQGPVPTTTVMVPLNPATQAGIYPSTGSGSTTFDPYAPQSAAPAAPVMPPAGSVNPYSVNPYSVNPYGAIPPSTPAYATPSPVVPPAGAGVYPNTVAPYGQPGVYPNTAPSALFPATTYGATPYGMPPSQSPYGTVLPPVNSWNPQSTFVDSTQIMRLCQGPRFRQSWIFGNDDVDALRISDSDVAVAFAFPNFCHSTSTLFVLPSFSLHQWAGPVTTPTSPADLPALAYSAFVDTGWQSNPERILGADLGLRIGWFSDFNTSSSDAFRVMGKAVGRLRITPQCTLKLGAEYLDRNQVQWLPAAGILWEPNPETRFDIYFPEPKLAHALSTIGTMDTWWYVAGYYGGGTWAITRESGQSDSIDINDIRLALGFEWGKNAEIRMGRRMAFFEVGYVFNRELVYKDSPQDNMDPQDTIMIRGGFGY